MNRRGATLLEVLLASVLLASAVTTASVLLGKIYSAALLNRQRIEAENLAASALDDIQKTPYGLLTLTPRSRFPFINVNCDCRRITDMATMPAQDPVLWGTVVYKRYVCVNYEQPSASGAWIASCEPARYPPSWVDPGFKRVRVQTVWTRGDGSTHAIETESVRVPS